MFTARKTSPVIALLGATAIALAGCSEPPEETPETTAADNGTATSAAREGDRAGAGEAASLTLYTSEPEEKVDEIIKAFNEEHPDIDVQVHRAGTGELKARIEAERSSGAVEADLIWAADAPTFEEFKSNDLLAKFENVDSDDVLEDAVDPDSFYVGTRLIPTVIAYNTQVIDEADAPQSWTDLTDERFLDKIVLPDPAVSGAAAYNATVWMNDSQLGEEWITALGENNPMIAASNGPTSQEIAGGGHPVGIVVDYLVRDLADKGSPIKEVYASEGSPYITEPIAVFKDSQNQKAAELFINFILSQKGQELAVEQNYLPVIDGVGTPGDAPELKDIKLMEADLKTLTDDRTRSVEFFQNALQ
ncbi:Iron-utilization periplasmic protein precursor [Corynebacterium glaucum]|uniref:ABC transporter substrate-binding protein n=1 Tax=Corynebacterium glaucum TaxID=187491 RepID=UPI0025B3FC50|nr:ABC transporter substrate-binding protein [Corynebacterium glaucum]WJZ07615.1 Iron-utilization periplasmic protein precursor [Corynebacterium glaucum]